MKLRIKGNSIRLRLTQSEVSRFIEIGSVEEITEFFNLAASENFVYAISRSKEKTVSAVFRDNRLTVYLPEQTADEWAQTNQIGICAEQKVSDEKTLTIAIEKDFACLDARPGEDDADAFPRPLSDTNC